MTHGGVCFWPFFSVVLCFWISILWLCLSGLLFRGEHRRFAYAFATLWPSPYRWRPSTSPKYWEFRWLSPVPKDFGGGNDIRRFGNGLRNAKHRRQSDCCRRRQFSPVPSTTLYPAGSSRQGGRFKTCFFTLFWRPIPDPLGPVATCLVPPILIR